MSDQDQQAETKSNPSKKRQPDLNTIYTINADGSRNFVQVADVTGRWQIRKRTVYTILLLIYLILPWIQIKGQPLLHFDIADRSAHFFGTTFTNQDFHLFFFGLIGVGLAIFIMTSLFGRVWCGLFCPQTLFLDGVFRPIERLLEGDHIKRIKRNKSGASAQKTAVKIVKHIIYLLLSWVFSVAFLAYFIPARELVQLLPFFPGHHTALIWSLFWTGMLYFDYSWFREQTCLIICPYGRLQSTLVDYDSLIIGYDKKRGEPRSKGSNGGDCIDCRRCVQVCPTGIDIRNGLQMECVGCYNCIDACDDIMGKIGKPRGLVRVSSSRDFETGKAQFFRPRFFIYMVVVIALAGLFVQRVGNRKSFHITAMRSRGLPYSIDGDQIRNLYTLHLQNKTDDKRVYFVSQAPDALAGHEGVSYIIPQPRVELDGLNDVQLTMFAMMPKSSYSLSEDFHISFTDSTSGVVQNVKVRFRGP